MAIPNGSASKIPKVAILLIATLKYKQFLPNVMVGLDKFGFKNQSIILFTDADQTFLDTLPRCSIKIFHIQGLGFPGDTLFRYHYFLQAELYLKQNDFTYVIYLDVDSDIVVHLKEEEILVEKGLVGTMHWLSLLGPQKENPNHIGTPETRSESTACIHPHEKMEAYWAGGFLGGTLYEFMDMCKNISEKIDQDKQKRIIALWHDESHLNRYFLDHPPVKVLSPAYVYRGICLTPEYRNHKICEVFSGIEPIIVDVVKDVHLVRA